MESFLTPLGEIYILFDGQPIHFDLIELAKEDKWCPDVNGRFKIAIKYNSDSREHSLACMLDRIDTIDEGINHESGERLEAQSFHSKETKLMIGAEGGSYYSNGKRYCDWHYDYDVTYLKNAMQYDILSITKSQEFIFGVSWITPYTKENEVQPWFGADPTMM